MGTGYVRGPAISVQVVLEVGQREMIGPRRFAAKACWHLRQVKITQKVIYGAATETGVRVYGMDLGSLLQFRKGVPEESSVFHGVRGGLYLHNQLQGILGIAGLRDRGGIAFVTACPLPAIGRVARPRPGRGDRRASAVCWG